MLDVGLKQNPTKSTMSDVHKNLDYRVYEDIYYQLIKHYERTLTDKRDRTVIRLKADENKIIYLITNPIDWQAKFPLHNKHLRKSVLFLRIEAFLYL